MGSNSDGWQASFNCSMQVMSSWIVMFTSSGSRCAQLRFAVDDPGYIPKSVTGPSQRKHLCTWSPPTFPDINRPYYFKAIYISPESDGQECQSPASGGLAGL